MVKTIDMQDIRYLNLFSKISKVNTKFCFMYNNTLIFCVPNKKMVYKAVGKDGKNVKKLSSILKKRIKVLSFPKNTKDIEDFIKKIIDPVTFKDIEINEDEIIITAGKTSKAALIGRNKRRLNEMQKIVRDFFKKEVKII